MFLNTMTTEELRKQFKEGVTQINGRMKYQCLSVRKTALKSNVFPYIRVIHHHLQGQNNDFLVKITIDSKSQIRHCKGFNMRYYGLMNTDNGIAIIDDTDYLNGAKGIHRDGKILPQPAMIYTPHLFHRYRERFGKLEEYRDIYEQYIVRTNYELVASCSLEGSHGEAYDVLMLIPDGVVLGSTEDNTICHMKTFLTMEMLNSKQRSYVEAIAELHKNMSLTYKMLEPKNNAYKL